MFAPSIVLFVQFGDACASLTMPLPPQFLLLISRNAAFCDAKVAGRELHRSLSVVTDLMGIEISTGYRPYYVLFLLGVIWAGRPVCFP
jgi:hypothetical protein